jgi:sec-independent protein translocase protein TatA
MIGPQDLWVALILAIFLFGAKKLPELSRSLGQSLAQFRKGLADSQDEARSSDAVAAAPKAAASPDPESQRPDS